MFGQTQASFLYKLVMGQSSNPAPAHVDKAHVKSILNSQEFIIGSGLVASSKGSFTIVVLWSPLTDFSSQMFL